MIVNKGKSLFLRRVTMKILDSALVKDHYDVVVVGAGNGGLTTAALLAKRGLKVLVIEQNYIPGGCVTAIRRHDLSNRLHHPTHRVGPGG